MVAALLMPRCLIGRPLTQIVPAMLRIAARSDLSPRAGRGKRCGTLSLQSSPGSSVAASKIDIMGHHFAGFKTRDLAGDKFGYCDRVGVRRVVRRHDDFRVPPQRTAL